MRTPLAAAVALTVALAGCVSPPEDVDAASLAPSVPSAGLSAPTVVADKNLTVDVPAWSVGDAWTIETMDEVPERATVVVVSASASSYEMATTSETHAIYDALFDMSYIGRIRGSDLAGHQQDQPVQFFSFPLSDGKRWTATWDGQPIELYAGFASDIPTPLGPQPGFRIQGTTADGQPYVQYDYVPAFRWWTHLMFSAGYGLKVTGTATNWTGNVQQATAKTLLTLAPAAPIGSTPAGVFTVEEGQTKVAVRTVGSTKGPYLRAFALFDGEGREHGGAGVTQGTGGTREFNTLIVPAAPGQWRLVAPSLHEPGGGFTITASQVVLAPRAVE